MKIPDLPKTHLFTSRCRKQTAAFVNECSWPYINEVKWKFQGTLPTWANSAQSNEVEWMLDPLTCPMGHFRVIHISQFPTACGHTHVMLCVFSHLAQDFLSGKTSGSSLGRICQKDSATGETLSNSLGVCLHNISPRGFTEPLLAGTLLHHFQRARRHKPQTCLKTLTALLSVFN